jgi:hypothetical protein
MNETRGLRQHTAHVRSVPAQMGGFLVVDDREATGAKWVKDELELAVFVHEHSQDEEYVPIGTGIHRLLVKMGVKKPCLPCAERQAWLDRLVKR